jgi:hypothetical protein
MKLISKKTRIKFNGERYAPNVPFDLNVKEIPQELVGIVEEYVENADEVKQFQSKRKNRNDGLLKKENTDVAKKTKTTKKSNKQQDKEFNESDLLDVGLELDNIE